MAKTSAKANPKNKDLGDRNRGSEPGQEQLEERHNRQNMGAGRGTRLQGKNQGRTRRGQGTGHTRTEKGDSRRSSRR
jgi:hypothetical protein